MRKGQMLMWGVVCRLTDNGKRPWVGILRYEPELRDIKPQTHDRYINYLARRLKLCRVTKLPSSRRGRQIEMRADPATIEAVPMVDHFSQYADKPEDTGIDYAAADKAWRKAFRWSRKTFKDAPLVRKIELRPELCAIEHQTLGGASCLRW